MNNDFKKNEKKPNIIKLNSNFTSGNLIYTKKLKIALITTFVILFLLIIRIGYIQFIDGNKLKELAYKQQTINQIISPKRGNIYDATGQALAISAQVDTITINPAKISDKDSAKSNALKEKVAKGLSDIFALNYDDVLKKVNSKSQVETIIRKVEKDKVDQLKSWMKENDISVGINIDEDSKRYYPYNNLASNVIGFCGSENQGSSGIEAKWNSVLTGTPGKIVSSKSGSEEEIPGSEESYISAENGNDLTLTIDLYIQNIVEKHLKQAVENNKCEKGGNVIVMNPKNGDILAMASYPDYNLNAPYTPNETLAKTYDSLTTDKKTESLFKMWSNKSVADSYEPGSTFKVITASVALEENITITDKEKDFICNGYEIVGDRNIKCWRHYNPHGYQSLRDALCNSCNPAFIQLASRITAPVLYKYYNAFGLFDSTNSGLYGEQNSIFHKLEEIKPVELATYSFGQRFQVTPLQMVTAISCVANNGVLMKPRIVKEVTNTDTGAVTEVPVAKVRQVISKSTSEKVKSMMESVVTDGTGKHAAVTGYSIGGKTGTSEPPEDKEDQGYVASYVAISPIEDTQVCLLLTLYDPPKNNHQGGQIAGPVVSQILSEILPYLGIPSDETSNTSSSSKNLAVVPDIRNKTITEAKKILQNAGFKTNISFNGDENSTLVGDQTPKPGVSLRKNSVIMLYAEGNTIATSVTVPDLSGLNASQAINTLSTNKLNISIEGSGKVVSQDPMKGEYVPEGTVVKVTLKQTLTDAH